MIFKTMGLGGLHKGMIVDRDEKSVQRLSLGHPHVFNCWGRKRPWRYIVVEAQRAQGGRSDVSKAVDINVKSLNLMMLKRNSNTLKRSKD